MGATLASHSPDQSSEKVPTLKRTDTVPLPRSPSGDPHKRGKPDADGYGPMGGRRQPSWSPLSWMVLKRDSDGLITVDGAHMPVERPATPPASLEDIAEVAELKAKSKKEST